jgi:hypothetical protein
MLAPERNVCFGEHWHERPKGVRHALRQGARRTLHGQYPAGGHLAFRRSREVGDTLAPDGGDCEKVLASFVSAGIDIDALAARLQEEGASSFVKSWNDLMACVDSKSAAVRKAN